MRAPPWATSRDCPWPLEGIPPVGPSAADITPVSDPRDKVRRAAGWALVGGLSVAALTAIAALLAGDFGDTEWRVILSSLGFAIASAVASAGATQRLRASGLLRDVGTATAVLAGIAFALLLAGLWTDDWGTEGIWRSFGCASVLAIAGSHACVVLGARRRSDSQAIDLLVTSSLVLAAVDTFGGLLPITGSVDEVGCRTPGDTKSPGAGRRAAPDADSGENSPPRFRPRASWRWQTVRGTVA